MYSTCIFCSSPLGTNEILERFPVGRRVAYDESTGRLWAVCRTCERWNLSPLETRCEAIEDAERVFRTTPLRVAGENIGLAQTAEGLELVRIGAPPRIELAAWRYGDQFQRRFRKQVIVGGGIGLAAAASFAITMADIAGLGVGSIVMGTGSMLSIAYNFGMMYRHRAGRARILISGQNDELLRLNRRDVRMTAIVPDRDGGWHLELAHRVQIGKPAKGAVVRSSSSAKLSGDVAYRAMSRLLPYLNREGGSRRTVRAAVDVIGESQSLGALMLAASTNDEARRTHIRVPVGKSNVAILPARIRLALEMALHEGDERRAMEGELAELEARWREADALAKIADDLLLPENVEHEIRAIREKTRP